MKAFRLFSILFIVYLTILSARASIIVKANDTLTAQHKSNELVKRPDVNPFDLGVLHFFQQFSRKSAFADRLIVFIADNSFLKGGIMMVVFWWLWILPRNQNEVRTKANMLLALFSNFVAIFMGRVIVLSTPFRIRPVDYPGLHIKLPVSAEKIVVDKLTSMPSDHAVLFYSICTGLFLVNRRIGIAAFIYTTVFVTFSRVYLCYHWASDVICGAFIGICVTMIICADKWLLYKAESIYLYGQKKPQIFYAVFFFLTYELSNMFEDVRSIITFIIHS